MISSRQPMNDKAIIRPPLPPTPVLSYEDAAPPPPFWLGRLICGLAIAYGTVSIGYVAASRIPGAYAGQHAWSDVPVAVSGLVLMVFGSLGILRISGSRLGIAVCALVLKPVRRPPKSSGTE